MDIKITLASKDDLPLIEMAFTDERFKFKQDRTGLKLRDPVWRILLAKHQDRVVGILTVKDSEKYKGVRHIDVVQVIESFRRNGIAKKLIETLENEVQEEKVRRVIEAQVDPPNGPSKPLLEKLGFQYNPLNACYQKTIYLSNS